MAIFSICPVSLTHLLFFKMLIFVVFKDVYVYNILEIKVGEISYFKMLFNILESTYILAFIHNIKYFQIHIIFFQ